MPSLLSHKGFGFDYGFDYGFAYVLHFLLLLHLAPSGAEFLARKNSHPCALWQTIIPIV